MSWWMQSVNMQMKKADLEAVWWSMPDRFHKGWIPPTKAQMIEEFNQHRRAVLDEKHAKSQVEIRLQQDRDRRMSAATQAAVDAVVSEISASECDAFLRSLPALSE